MPSKKEKDPKAQWTGKQPVIKRIFHVNLQPHQCIKCLRLIEVIHRLNKSTEKIESHYQSEFKLLKNAVRIAMSDMLDIIASLK